MQSVESQCVVGQIDRIPQIAPHVGIVQLGDAKRPPNGEQNRCPLGEGGIPLKEIVAAFNQAGFDGYYDVELMGEEIEAVNYQNLLTRSRQEFADFCGG